MPPEKDKPEKEKRPLQWGIEFTADAVDVVINWDYGFTTIRHCPHTYIDNERDCNICFPKGEE